MRKEELLNYYFGFNKLKDYQEEIIDNLMEGKDVIGLLPTGYGKSITFQLPALMLDGITIVVSPLIALMQDQVINLKANGIKAEFINSLQTPDEQDIIYERLKQNKIKILYVSGERLQNKKFINEMLNLDIDLFVCDEAHTLLWSEDFRYALGEIPLFLEKLKKRPKILALTATSTDITSNKITNLLKLNNPIIVRGNPDRPNIFYKIIKTKDKDRDLYFYIRDKINEHILIYCLTIKKVIHVSNYLKEKGIESLIYHGALESEEKKRTLLEYKNNKCNVIVCTNAFGMGIDIPNIRYVIEYDLPSSIEDFSQQTGRGSRDGKNAEAVLLFNINDIKTIEYFIDNIEDEAKSDKELKKIKNDRREKLDKVVKLAISNNCIHKTLSEYFGFKYDKKCNMCSNCVKNKYRI